MICKCGTDAELKVFSTFQYYYCGKCKDEVRATPALKYEGVKIDVGAITPQWNSTVFYKSLAGQFKAPYAQAQRQLQLHDKVRLTDHSPGYYNLPIGLEGEVVGLDLYAE